MSAASSAAQPAAAAGGGVSSSSSSAGPVSLEALLQQRRFTDVLSWAQQRELEEGGLLTRDSEQLYGIELLSAMLCQNNLSAKFVWQRVPAELKKKSPELQALWKLVSSLLQRDFIGFFAQSSAAALPTPLLARMLTLLREEVQRVNLRAMASAYTVISAEAAAALLGMTAEQSAAALTAQGWTAAAAAQQPQGAPASARFFTPPPLDRSKPRDISHKQIEQLTGYITHLEE